MENFKTQNYTHLEDTRFNIYDLKNLYYGGSQYWFPKKFNKLSGCGPVVAANITAYLAHLDRKSVV